MTDICEKDIDYWYAETYKIFKAVVAALLPCGIPGDISHEWNCCGKNKANLGPLEANAGACRGRVKCCPDGHYRCKCSKSPAPSMFAPAADLTDGIFSLGDANGCCSELMDLHTGNMVIYVPVVDFPTKGNPLEVSLTYNTQFEMAGLFGYGWNSSLERHIDPITLHMTNNTGSLYRYIELPGGNDFKLDDVIVNDRGSASYWMNTALTKEIVEDKPYYVESIPTGKKYHFNYSNGRLEFIRDPLGNRINYNYGNPKGVGIPGSVLLSIDDDGQGEFKRKAYFEYNSAGRISKVTDPYGNSTHFFYSNEFLTQIVGPNGCVTSFTYDSDFRIASKTSPNGGVSRFHYNSEGRLISYTDPLEQETTFTYDYNLVVSSAFKADVYVRTPDNKQWLWEFNQASLLDRVIDPDGKVTTFGWNDENLIRVVEGMIVEATGVDYPPYRYVAGSMHSFMYDDNDRIMLYIDPQGITTHLTYNEYGDPLQVTNTQVNYQTRGNFEGIYGTDGYLLCSFDNSGPADEDIVSLPSYISEIQAEEDKIVRVNDGISIDPSAPFYTPADERRIARWYYATGSGSSATNYSTSSITFRMADTVSQPHRFTLSAYGFSFIGEENVPGWNTSYNTFWRRITYSVSDSSGVQSFTVQNTFPGTWVSFPVTGMSGSDVTLAMSVDLTESANLSLTALAFDPVRESRVKYEYDDYRNLTRVTDAEGNYSSYYYGSGNTAGLLMSASDFMGNVTHLSYDDYGNVTRIESPVGSGSDLAVTTFAYDTIAHSDVTSVTDPEGNTTHFEYDTKRRLKKIISPENETTEVFYNISDNIIKIRDTKGIDVVKYTYDILNRVTKETYATGATVEYDYTPAGTINTVTDPRGNVTTFEYYDNQWLKKVYFPDGSTVSYEYNSSGDMVKAVLPDSNYITYEYYLDHAIKKVTLPDASTRQAEYDIYGQIKRLIDGRGNEVYFSYDTLQQLVNTIVPLSGIDKITSYEYNENGDVTRVTDARGNHTDYTYDKAGRVTRIDYPDETFETYVYDDAGNVTSHTDGKNRTTTFTYDADSRLTKVTLPNSSTVRYTYDTHGRLIKRTDTGLSVAGGVSNPDSYTTYRYDTYDRLIEVGKYTTADTRLYKQRFTYDFTGSVTSVTDDTGAQYNTGVAYAQAETVGAPEGAHYDQEVKYGQATFGHESRSKYGNVYAGEVGEIVSGQSNISGRIKYGIGVDTHYVYDNLGRLVEYTDYLDNIYYYGYDHLGRNTLVRYPNGTFTRYTFDSAGRLGTIIHEKMNQDGTRTLMESFTYQYDLNGNITSITSADSSKMEYRYDQWNRLVEEHRKSSDDLTLTRIQYSFDTAEPDKYGDTGNICAKIEGNNWWDTDWAYKALLKVDNRSESALTDYQVKFTLDTASLIAEGRMKNDGSDIRILNAAEDTPLTFWVDPTTVNTTKTEVWVKFSSIPIGETFCYLYYGNPSAASASSGAGTFLFYDDFNSYTDGQLAGQGNWTGVTWMSVQGAVTREGAKAVRGNSTAVDYVYHSLLQQNCRVISCWLRAYDDAYARCIIRENGATLAYWDVETDSAPFTFHYTDNGDYTSTDVTCTTDTWYRSVAYVYGKKYDLSFFSSTGELLWSKTGICLNLANYSQGADQVGLGGLPRSASYYDLVLVGNYTEGAPPVGEVQFHYSQGAGTTLATTTFTYDEYNKLTGMTNPDGTTETLTYDDNGQLTRRETYDGAVLQETTVYEWDDRGLLTRVVLPTGEPVCYTYDGAGRLIGRKDADGEESYIQSGWDIVKELDENKRRTYYTGASMLRDDGTMANGSNALYFHYDHLGNTRLVTDEKGEVVQRFNYEAYGKTVDGEGQEIDRLTLKSQPYLYVGAYGVRYDMKTEMHYMRNRWFSSQSLRFISFDLYLKLNRFAYVIGNPIRLVDPKGLNQEDYYFYSVSGDAVFDAAAWTKIKSLECCKNVTDLPGLESKRNKPGGYFYASNLPKEPRNVTKETFLENIISMQKAPKQVYFYSHASEFYLNFGEMDLLDSQFLKLVIHTASRLNFLERKGDAGKFLRYIEKNNPPLYRALRARRSLEWLQENSKNSGPIEFLFYGCAVGTEPSFGDDPSFAQLFADAFQVNVYAQVAKKGGRSGMNFETHGPWLWYDKLDSPGDFSDLVDRPVRMKPEVESETFQLFTPSTSRMGPAF